MGRNICDWCEVCESKDKNTISECMRECCGPLDLIIAVENYRNMTQREIDNK